MWVILNDQKLINNLTRPTSKFTLKSTPKKWRKIVIKITKLNQIFILFHLNFLISSLISNKDNHQTKTHFPRPAMSHSPPHNYKIYHQNATSFKRQINSSFFFLFPLISHELSSFSAYKTFNYIQHLRITNENHLTTRSFPSYIIII